MMGIATDSLRTYIFRVINGIVGFLIGILIARFMGPTGKGYYSLIFLVYMIYIFVFGNLGGAIIYQVARLRQPAKTVFVTSAIYSFFVGVLTIIGFGIYTIFVGFSIHSVWLVVLVTPLTLILTDLNGTFQGLNRIRVFNWIGLASVLVQLFLLCIIFFVFKLKLLGAIICWTLAQLFAVSVGLWVGRDFWRPVLKQSFNLPVLKKMLVFGWQMSVNNLVSYLNFRIDSILVPVFLGIANYGLYSVAVGGAEILWYASGAVGTAIVARVGMAELEQAGRLTLRAARHTLFVNCLFGIVMWFAAELVPVIYSRRFTASVLPFHILLPGVLAYSLAGIFSTYFTNQLGKPRVPLLIASISMIIDLVGCLILIPKIGMAGAALASTISYIVSICVFFYIFCKYTKLHWKEFLITREDLDDYDRLWKSILKFLRIKAG